MIRRLFQQITESLTANDAREPDPADREQAIRRATAVLMLDVAMADKAFNQQELAHLLELAQSHFDLPYEDAAELIETAKDEAEDVVSLHEFTHLLHHNLSEADKAGIIAMLWQIAYADGNLDKYENSLILKISDLLYVSRGRVMRLKHDAEIAARPD